MNHHKSISMHPPRRNSIIQLSVGHVPNRCAQRYDEEPIRHLHLNGHLGGFMKQPEDVVSSYNLIFVLQDWQSQEYHRKVENMKREIASIYMYVGIPYTGGGSGKHLPISAIVFIG